MGAGTLYGPGIPLYPQEIAPIEVHPILADALQVVENIHSNIRSDAARNNEDLSVRDHALRIYDLGSWAARQHEGPEGSAGVASALRLLAGAARYGNVRQQMIDGRGKVFGQERGRLARYACTYNAHIRTFGYNVSSARVDHAVDAMADLYEMVSGERARGRFANTVDGMLQQMIGKRAMEFAAPVREATLTEDLTLGYDVVLRVSKNEGIPFDLTACAAAVMDKCQLAKPAKEAVRKDGVMVVSVGARKAEVGDTFEIDESLARRIYNKRMATTIRRARDNPKVRRVPWNERGR